MNEKEIKEKIEFAKKIAEKYGGEYQEEVFKIFFANSIQESNFNLDNEKGKENQKNKIKKDNLISKKEELAKLCKITVRELSDVLKIDQNEVKLQKTFTGPEAEQQVIGSQLILLASELVLGIQQIESRELKGILKESNITDRQQHFPRNLSNAKNIFSISPISKTQKGYSLTANKGRTSAIELLRKLAKGET